MTNDSPSGGPPPSHIASEKILAERNPVFLDLLENRRGRFLKITEVVSGRRDTIILPAASLSEFIVAMKRLIDFEKKL